MVIFVPPILTLPVTVAVPELIAQLTVLLLELGWFKVTSPLIVRIPVAVCVIVVFAVTTGTVKPVQVLVLLMVQLLPELNVIVPKLVVPVPLIVFDAPVNVVAGDPVNVPPLFKTLPEMLMVKPPEFIVPSNRLRLLTVNAAPSVAIPELLLIVI